MPKVKECTFGAANCIYKLMKRSASFFWPCEINYLKVYSLWGKGDDALENVPLQSIQASYPRNNTDSIKKSFLTPEPSSSASRGDPQV